MTAAAVVLTLCAAGLNGFAGVLGAWRFYAVAPSRGFWLALRAGQAGAVVVALFTGVAAVAGRRPDNGLFYLYALLPLAISLIGEQLRIASADTVLEARGFADAQAVGQAPEDEQRSIVTAILRREMGVMAVTALVV